MKHALLVVTAHDAGLIVGHMVNNVKIQQVICGNSRTSYGCIIYPLPTQWSWETNRLFLWGRQEAISACLMALFFLNSFFWGMGTLLRILCSLSGSGMTSCEKKLCEVPCFVFTSRLQFLQGKQLLINVPLLLPTSVLTRALFQIIVTFWKLFASALIVSESWQVLVCHTLIQVRNTAGWLTSFTALFPLCSACVTVILIESLQYKQTNISQSSSLYAGLR